MFFYFVHFALDLSYFSHVMILPFLQLTRGFLKVLSVYKMAAETGSVRERALVGYRKKLLEHRELEARLKDSM